MNKIYFNSFNLDFAFFEKKSILLLLVNTHRDPVLYLKNAMRLV